MYNYSNNEKRESTFICLPSNNFGYGYPMYDTGFVYLESEPDGEQQIVNDSF